MSPHRQDSEPIAYANQAPRCQHVRLSGARCGSPALRRKRFCQLHQAVVELEELNRTLGSKVDAIALQFVLMQVMRLLEGQAPDYRACRLMLYALQISRANLKNFRGGAPRSRTLF